VKELQRPVLVVGDAMLDRDLTGDVGGVVSDTTAPIVALRHLIERPGGAALAALTLARTGTPVTLAAPLADDADGIRLQRLLTGVTVLPLSTVARTRSIARVRGSGHTIVRYDTEGTRLTDDVPVRQAQLAAAVTAAAAVLVADYGAGTTAHPAVRRVLDQAVDLRRPVVWDPHPRGHAPVPGITVATPNRREVDHMFAQAGLERPVSLSAAARVLLTLWNSQAVVATDGSHGAVVAQDDGSEFTAAAPQQVAGDACGAGDRFAATLTAALASGRQLPDGVSHAVADVAAWLQAGGIATESTPFMPGEREKAVVATGGCFDILHAGHVALLQGARQLGDRLVVLLNSDESVRRLKGPDRPVHRAEDRRRVLESLACVDQVIVFDDDTPARALAELKPAIWAKGADYTHAPMPEAELLEQWGGRVVFLPYVPYHSTTRILDHGALTASQRRGRSLLGPP
jgi:D-beta-D-heptose 7-phosphate kinase / D-beta-D-heptose 1-phosphate adenosyltransferase